MVSVKSFVDGDRLVVVFEGISNAPSESELVKSYIESVLKTQTMPPADVTPVPADEEPIDIPEEVISPVQEVKPIRTEVFIDGPYEGKTPEEILSKGTPKDKREAFRYLTRYIKSEVSEEETDLVKESEKCINEILAKFSTDGETYTSMLNEKQVNLFIYQFIDVFSNEKRDEILSSVGTSIDKLPAAGEDIKREIVKRYINNIVK